MPALIRRIDRFCEKNRRFGIPRLMIYLVGGMAALFFLQMMGGAGGLWRLLALSPERILRGEVWRLVSWVFLPMQTDLFGLVLSLYFFWFIGTTLEQAWGCGRFTIFYLSGVLLHVLYAFAIYFLRGTELLFVDAEYLNLSMFFAYAALYPDERLSLFFFIPIKVKWLALADAAFFAYGVVTALLGGSVLAALFPVVAVLNFILLCGVPGFTLRQYVPNARTARFRQEVRGARRERERAPYLHKCAVCGRTDTTNPALEFRYCALCAGERCYCDEHIGHHEHFTEPRGG